jgi:hypothetical protein
MPEGKWREAWGEGKTEGERIKGCRLLAGAGTENAADALQLYG